MLLVLGNTLTVSLTSTLTSGIGRNIGFSIFKSTALVSVSSNFRGSPALVSSSSNNNPATPAQGDSNWSRISKFFNKFIMSDPLARLEKNALEAEKLIAEICSKIQDIEKKNIIGKKGGDVDRLKVENDRLRAEIQQWKDLLIVRQIRNGKRQVPVPILTAQKPQGTNNAVLSSNGEASKGPVSTEAKKKKPSAPEKVDAPAAGAAVESRYQNQKAKAAAAVGTGKAKTASKPAPAPPAEEVVDVSRLDFRIGKIVEVDKHPDADSLYLEKIDVGEAGVRTVVSGLVKHVPIEEMRDRMVVVLCNLKPAKMRGVTSEAMVMCASTPEKVEILIPPQGAVPGDLVDFKGFTRNPDGVLNPKKKIFETVAPDLKTDGNKVATYKGIPFEIKGKGVVTTASLIQVQIK